jgi:hypothetical protein
MPFTHACRNADLEVILATDLNQLGQVPKLQALAISALRSRLLAELEALIASLALQSCSCGSCNGDKAKQVRTNSPPAARILPMHARTLALQAALQAHVATGPLQSPGMP